MTLVAPDGAFQIGGGWGQDLEESTLLNQVVPIPNPTEPLKQVSSIFHGMPKDAVEAIQPFVGKQGGILNIAEGVTNFLDSLGDRPKWLGEGTFADWLRDKFDPVAGSIKETISGWFDGWGGAGFGTSTGLGPLSVHATAAQVLAAFNQLNAQFQQLAADNTSGVKAYENFGTYPDGSPGAKWSSWHQGGLNAESIEVKSGRLRLQNVLLTSRYGQTRYNVDDTSSDFQRIGVSFGARPASGLLGKRAANRILGRLSAEDTSSCSFVFAELEDDSASIGCQVAGNATVFKKVDTFNFNPGSAYWLQCGVKGTSGGADAPYTFRLYENNTLLFEALDGGRVSRMGVSNRWTGMAFDNPTLQSASVSSFAMYDN